MINKYNNLKNNTIIISIDSFNEISDTYIFKVFVYLCMRSQNYCSTNPICSYNEISEDCKIGITKCKEAIKWLVENNFIKKYRNKDFDKSNISNEYVITKNII